MTSRIFTGTDFITFGTENLATFSEKLNELGQRNSSFRDDLYTNILTSLGESIRPRLRLATPHGATGALQASTNFRIIIIPLNNEETEYRLEMIQTAAKDGFIYRPITVFGRFSGKMPPVLALRGWVELKWGLSGIQADKGAFLLARHIAAHGTKPNNYTSRVVQDSRSDIETAAQELGQQLTVQILDFS